MSERSRLAGRSGAVAVGAWQPVGVGSTDRLEQLIRECDVAWRAGDRRRYWELYEDALRATPTTALGLASRGRLRIRAGDYVRGFSEKMHERRAAGAGRALAALQQIPLWRGQRLDGALLLYNDDGYGDALMVSRYVPLVAERTGSVVLLAQPELRRLFAASLPPKVDVVTASATITAVAQCPILALPFVFATTRATVPPLAPVSTPSTALLPGRDGVRVGLCWSGNPDHPRDDERSCRLEDLRPLLEIPGVTWYAMQRNTRAAEAAAAGIVRTDHLITDFADTAALMLQLHAMVTVDSAPAHLAGALGIPTLLLLACGSEWRWGMDTETTPWYPTMRLLRQPQPGDWASVAQRAAELIAVGDLPPRSELACR
jgi:hypothetical protein